MNTPAITSRAIMKLSPDISHLDFIRACRDRIRFSPESENGAKEDSRPKLYLGFHLTDSEIFSASSNIGPGYYDIPECPDDNDEDYSSLARGEAIMRISLFLNSKSKPPAKSKRMGATFVESCPPSKDPGAFIYSDELKKWCPRNLEEKVKKYEHIFNTEILPGKNRKMMWHFDGQHYHPRWFGYEPFDAQKVLGEKLAEVVARHRPQL
ncbi:hypothetical protein C2E23DRAFT_799908 [Lenzites betulinus]|nr:hypothetical protein C2E23DRAFT_799908 [Lenzites betulinus]